MAIHGVFLRDDYTSSNEPWHSTWTSHAPHHHGVETARHLEELHLLLLHVHCYFGVLVYLMCEECSLELFLCEAVVLEDPIMCDCAD